MFLFPFTPGDMRLSCANPSHIAIEQECESHCALTRPSSPPASQEKFCIGTKTQIIGALVGFNSYFSDACSGWHHALLTFSTEPLSCAHHIH